MLRILVVDDRPEVRFGLRLRLGAEADMTVAGEAGDGQAAIELAGELAPDLILLDIELPSGDGIEVVRTLHELYPHIPVVVLTLRDNDATRERAAAAHAAGFVSKHAAVDCLLETVRSCALRRGPHSCRDD